MLTDTVSLHEGEEIISVIRRHWFRLAIEAGINLFIFVFVSSVVVVTNTVVLGSGGYSEYTVFLPLGFFVLGFIGLLLWMHFFASWSDHWLDAWVITTERVINIEQHGFFKREVSSYPIEKIQDVTYTISGIIPTWLDFGDVRVQTASISEDLIMKQVPFPELMKEQLIDLISTE